MKHLILILLVVTCVGLVVFDSCFGLLRSPWWGIGLLILCIISVTGFFFGLVMWIKGIINKGNG